MKSRIPRLFLGLNALTFTGIGIYFLLRPETVASGLGLEAADATAFADIRAVYGGLEIGLGVALIWTLLDWQRTRMGLGLAMLMWCGLLGGRVVGVVVDGAQSTLGYGLLASEIIGAALTAVALWKS